MILSETTGAPEYGNGGLCSMDAMHLAGLAGPATGPTEDIVQAAMLRATNISIG